MGQKTKISSILWIIDDVISKSFLLQFQWAEYRLHYFTKMDLSLRLRDIVKLTNTAAHTCIDCVDITRLSGVLSTIN